MSPASPRAYIGSLGWLPDFPDGRDFPYSAVAPVGAALPPRSAPLGAHARSDQGSLGSCTGNAAATVLEIILKRLYGIDIDLSRLFAYYLGRERLGTIDRDSGAMPRDVVKGLVAAGIPTEATWPYILARFRDTPSALAYAEAARHKASAYASIATVEEGRASLDAGRPYTVGFTVYQNFSNAGDTGHYPKPAGGVAGGHDVAAVLYDDNEDVPGFGRGAFLIENSWGSHWGIPHPDYPTNGAGHFWFPYSAFADRNLSDDSWHIAVPTL